MFMQHFVHGLGIESAEYLDMTSEGGSVHCTVEEGKLILDRVLSITSLENLQLKAPHIYEEELIITYPDASEVSTSPARELLQLTASEISSNKEEDDPTPFSLSIEEDCFEYDIGNLSKDPTYDKKGLFFELAGQDQDEFMVSQENLLRLSAIISRGWSEAVDEADSYVRIYPGSNAICCRLQGFSFQMVCYDPRVGLNILLLDEASDIDLQSLVPSTKILLWQLVQKLQWKGVVPITMSIEGSKVFLEYHIFHYPSLTFILIGVPLHALLKGTDNGESLKMAMGQQILSSSFARAVNHAAEDELEEDVHQ
jgi:hypothetical protein